MNMLNFIEMDRSPKPLDYRSNLPEPKPPRSMLTMLLDVAQWALVAVSLLGAAGLVAWFRIRRLH
jgi:nitrate reductase NapE component